MSKEFDPDKAHVKQRSMTGVTYEQNGNLFNSGFVYLGKVKDDKKPKPAADPKKEKEDVRAAARAKINRKKKKTTKKKKGGLDGYRGGKASEAVSTAHKENEAARQAEEHA